MAAMHLPFLEFMLAGTMAGLAREAMRARAQDEEPDNLCKIPPDPRAWQQIHSGCKRDHLVVVIEITDDVHENCKRVRPQFTQLAREFDGVPFLRVELGPGESFKQLRHDLGGVQFTPTILVLWFGADKIYRAKYEGETEILKGLSNGRMKEIISDFKERRKKLKITQHMMTEVVMAARLGIHNEMPGLVDPEKEEKEENVQSDPSGEQPVSQKIAEDSAEEEEAEQSSQKGRAEPEKEGKGRGNGSSSTTELTLADLHKLVEKLEPISLLWHPLGKELGLEAQTLIYIAQAAQSSSDPSNCGLSMMLTWWLHSKAPTPSLETLADTLAKPQINGEHISQSLLKEWKR